MNIRFSLLRWTLGSPRASEIGLGNYIEFFTSPDARIVLTTTLIFTVATVVGAMVLGFFIALALNTRVKGRTFARAAVFAPYVLSGVGVGLVWLFIFDPSYGLLGIVLRMAGITSPDWFGNSRLTLLMIILVYIWKNVGFCAVVYLAGLQSLPSSVMEAAMVDGAPPLQRIRHIIIPLLGPTTFFLLITSTLNSLQAFDLIRVMAPQSPGTRTLIYEAYLQAFGAYNRAGYSAMVSVVLFIILIVITIINLTVVEKKVHYS